jgi:hypothetical protein
MDEDITAAWDRVVESWDDDARHEALLGLVALHSSYAWAAARYKERAGDPIADRQLAKIQKAAMIAMLATSEKTEAEKGSPYVKTMVWVVILILMLLLGLMLAKVMVEHKPRPPAPHRG